MAGQDDNFEHHGIKGQKWGVRRFQNEDGSLTNAGKDRYDKGDRSASDEEAAEFSNELLKKNPYLAIPRFQLPKRKVKRSDGKEKSKDSDKELKKKKIKKALAIALGVAIVAGASYAVYKHAGGKALFKSSEFDDEAAASKLKKAFKDHDIDESDANGARFVANWCNFADTKLKKSFTREEYNALSNNDGITLASGSVLHRISTVEESSMQKPGLLGFGTVEKKTCYCSFDKEDNDRYKAFLPAMYRVNMANSWFGAPDKFYDVTMNAKNTIKSPSSKERVDAYLDLMNDAVNREKFKNHMIDRKCPIPMISAFEKDPIAGYRIFSLGLADQDASYNVDYFSKLKKAGYNALVDDNDAGNLSKSPLIVLDPKSILSIVSNKEVTSQDRRDAWKRLSSSSLLKNEDNSALNKALSPFHPLGRMAYKAYMKEILDNNASIAHSQLIGGEDMVYNDTFEHHGIKGQRWGVRRYQNADGSLTDAGKRKYSKDLEKAEYKKYQEAYYNREKYSTKQLNEMNNRMNAEMNFKRNLENARPKKRSVEFGKKFAMGVAAVITAKATSELANYIYKSGRDYAIKAIVQGDTGMNELYSFEHHGIKGQKWGVRRTRQQLGYKIKNSKALGMYGGDRKKNREALKDMRTRMDNNKEGLNKVKSLDRASTVQHVLGNMFGGGVGIALHTASVADRKRARDAYTDVRSKAYEETKQKYGEDAANRALRHQKKVEQRVKVALGAAIVADTIFVTADINRTMNGGRSHV